MPRTLATLLRNRWIWPSIILVALGFLALFAPLLAPMNTQELSNVRLEDSYRPPIWLIESSDGEATAKSEGSLLLFSLGADGQGRDLYSALLFGLRVSLLVGVCGTLIALVAGVTLGLIAGYRGGRFDAAVMRLADIQLSFPSVLIALFLMAVWGQGLGKIIIAVGLVHWVIYARVVRGGVLAEREKDYISAVIALGARTPRILFFHLLPNLSGPIFVVSAVQFASIVMLEATLSYLGLGVPITRPSLGMLIKNGYDDFFSGHWWVCIFPGLVLVILIVAINWLADDLRYRFSVRD